jgi:phosphoadenosine phosphosulfate reductase
LPLSSANNKSVIRGALTSLSTEDVSITGSVAARLRNTSAQYGFEPQELVDYVVGVLNGTEANISKVDELLPLDAKIEIAKTVVRSSLSNLSRPLVLFSGSKESVLTLYLTKLACEGSGNKIPPLLFVDHFMHYDQTLEFVTKVAREWNLDLKIARQENLSSNKLNETIRVSDLTEEQKQKLKKIGFGGFDFPFSLENPTASYLLNVLVIDDYANTGQFDGIFVSDDSYMSGRSARSFLSNNGDWKRVSPLLLLTSRDVWTSVRENNLPSHPLYVNGDENVFNKYATPVKEKAKDTEEVEFAGVVENLKRLGYA